MRALHIPGVPEGSSPAYRFPDKPCPAEDLVLTDDYPDPSVPEDATTNIYIVRVEATGLTKGELTWQEVLEPHRFRPYGGAIPGFDVVGTISSIYPSKAITVSPKFAVGDQVWGFKHPDDDGGAAGLISVREQDITRIPPKPANTAPQDWTHALCTIPLSGLTAYQALFDHGALPRTSSDNTFPRKHILITGAAGSVGVPTVQLAKQHHFHITAVCSSRHKSFLQDELHVDAVIDYTSPTFESIPHSYATESLPPTDLVIDCVGGDTALAMLSNPSFMRRGGKIILLAAPMHALGSGGAVAAATKALQDAGVEQEFFIVEMNAAQLDELGELVVAGKLKPFVDEVFPLEKGREAMMKVERKGAVGCGKVVIRVESS
jgi:NADPH:quinone reductase-like Zn-dependent oxidoreductase